MQAPSTEILQTLTLEAPVTQVTLLEDRAQVRRVGKVALTPGLWRMRVEAVAPVLSDKSLRAEFCGEALAARIDDVRMRRQMVVKQSEQPEAIQGLWEELRSLRRTFSYLTEDRQHLESNFEQISDILEKAVEELPVDAAWGQLDSGNWREHLQTLFQQLRDSRADILNSYYAQERLCEQINTLVNRIDALRCPTQVYTAAIETDVMIAQAGNYELAFDYGVPNALWRPWHQARLLLNETPTLSFRVDGCVWQRTGEDWNQVDLVFSTARASLGTEPPLLQDDVLNIREKSKQIVVQARDQTIQTAGLGSDRSPGTLELPGVDDGGEVRILRSATKATIPADGRPYRVPLFSFETPPAQVEYLLMPELSCQVVLKSEQVNLAAFPILAGPVDLIRSSEFVGRTSLGFIAPQEKFALGWGPEATMRVQRTQTQKKEENHLTRWQTLTKTTQLFLSNIGAEPRMVKTIERVPISELEQVKVEVITDKTTEAKQPDQNGFCTWNLTLPPYSQQSVQLVYKISSAPEVQGL
ncbi:MAG: mucoidy inhibitor MuiA family protein [Leptolyngbyaceae bacterium]|nr:mucoidy inhibitor MuiA family protein [Leptolyngbyaceae bacterium]